MTRFIDLWNNSLAMMAKVKMKTILYFVVYYIETKNRCRYVQRIKYGSLYALIKEKWKYIF